ncbi:glycoside hydrolase family 15 protein [Methyloceanibacter sp.]|uniref:glycoside hydrolase family 15 protein n=1 Tax=Methyloceanibacter sp. TaxID=1965321 RepID=UPI002C5A32FC|nr:glycoside hydrolase family 15 protein [Methyloceanibacter sp.]HML92910.1 glycoside hydrolase family 15 protein [Methyloceanibacter sp.]
MKAPNGPCTPTWAPARKDIIGRSLGSSRLWYTLAQGIVTELYYPRIDIPQIKDLGFIVADGKDFWVELRRNGDYTVTLAAPGVPSATVVHRHSRFTFTAEVTPSQRRDVLLIRYTLEGDAALKPYALLAARLGDDSQNNMAYAGTHDGRAVLWAKQGPFALALTAAGANGSEAYGKRSVGCLGISDGWQDFDRNGRMTWTYDEAGPGAVSLMGELSPAGLLSLGFAATKEAAATLSAAALMDNFDEEIEENTLAWQSWLRERRPATFGGQIDDRLALSATVIKVHQDQTFRGAAIASLSIPWGDTSTSRGGYHLVWPRDLVQTAGALVAMGSFRDAREVLRYLMATQHEDGHWFQNQWLGGRPFWQGVQLDEAAFPILLAAALQSHGALDGIPVKSMIARAAGFICRTGPTTDQDRWEEDSGLNMFTIAVAIAALAEAAEYLDGAAKTHALRVADYWNAKLEDWAFVRGTELAGQLGVKGYFIRTVPLDALGSPNAGEAPVVIKNLSRDPNLPASGQVSTDCLQLVRYGLRSADDPAITDTIKVMDHLLKTGTPSGPVWHRYNNDGYGEHKDGSGFDGTGHGRGWPLLTGERGHYALAAGEDVMPYIEAMMAMSNPVGLMPEQIWDTDPIPEHGLFPGRPSGSAMPLVWTHAEFAKLCHSLAAGRPVDRPQAAWTRYRGERPKIDYEIWGPRYRPGRIAAGRALYVAVTAPALVHFGINGWQDIRDIDTADTLLGVHVAKLPTDTLEPGDRIEFTFFWPESGNWEGRNFEVTIEV